MPAGSRDTWGRTVGHATYPWQTPIGVTLARDKTTCTVLRRGTIRVPWRAFLPQIPSSGHRRILIGTRVYAHYRFGASVPDDDRWRYIALGCHFPASVTDTGAYDYDGPATVGYVSDLDGKHVTITIDPRPATSQYIQCTTTAELAIGQMVSVARTLTDAGDTNGTADAPTTGIVVDTVPARAADPAYAIVCVSVRAALSPGNYRVKGCA